MESRLPNPVENPQGDTIQHGTNHGYNYYTCRCAECKAAHAAVILRASHKRAERLAELPPEAHGKVSTYTNWRCRCDLCRAAGAAARRDWVERQKRGGGVRRMCNLGHTHWVRGAS